MPDLLTSIRIDLAGNLVRRARQYQDAMHTFSTRGQRDLSMLQRSTAALGRGIDHLGNRYTAILTGAAAAGTARWVMSLERRFTRLGIQANASADDVERLKKEIFETSRAPDIRIDPSELTAAVEEIIERTGDLDFARKNLENFALAIGATGAAGTDIGGIAAEFQKMGIIDPRDVREALNILTTQGKEGAFTLQKLATLGPRVVTAYTAMGRQGVPAIREMGAALQVIMRGTGDADRAATAFEAMLRTLSDPKKVKLLQQGGIQVFDVEALKEGREVLRPINEVMEEIVSKAKGKQSIINTIFEAEAARAFNDILGEFNKTGDVTILDRFMELQADSNLLLDDSSRAAGDASAAMQALYTSWQKFADAKLTGPIQDAADLLDKLGNKGADTALNLAAGAAAGGLALWGGRKIWQAGKGIAGLFGKKGAGAVADTAMGAMSGATPVYVVNMPGAGLLGGTADAATGAAGAGAAATVASKWKATLALLGGSKLSALRMMGMGAMTTAGAGVAAAGAAGYGVGTVLRMGIDQGLSLATGEKTNLGSVVYDLLHSKESMFLDQQEKERRNKIDVSIKVDSEGKIRVTQVRSDSKDINVDTDVGLVMAGP